MDLLSNVATVLPTGSKFHSGSVFASLYTPLAWICCDVVRVLHFCSWQTLVSSFPFPWCLCLLWELGDAGLTGLGSSPSVSVFQERLERTGLVFPSLFGRIHSWTPVTGVFSLGRVFITDTISLINTSLFRLFISSWVNLVNCIFHEIGPLHWGD